MPAILFACPSCKQSLEVHEDLYGKTTLCRSCGHEIMVPDKQMLSKMPLITQAYAQPVAQQQEHDEEQLVMAFKPTAKAFIGRILLGILLTPLVIGLFLLLHVWYTIASLRYRLTTQRLFVQRGLIAKHLEEVELFRVKDALVQQSMMQRLLGYGTITVLSSDDTTPQILLIGINNPVEVKETLRSTFRAARKREGVRMSEYMPS